MNDYQETSSTWNKIAELYEEKFMELKLYNASYDTISKHVPKQGKVFEIGCGPGNIAKYVLSQRPDIDWFGIDYAPNMIELAKKNNPHARFEVLDSRDVNTIHNNFDAVVSGFCLPYLDADNCQKLLDDMYDLLGQKGYLYVSFVEGNPANSGFQIGSSGDRIFFNYHDLDVIKSKLQKLGFQEIKVEKVSFERNASSREQHTIVTARKK